jgi:hypothetical protein
MDWMTADELSRAYELKRMLPSAAAEAEAARERIRARIAERRSRPGRGTAPKL